MRRITIVLFLILGLFLSAKSQADEILSLRGKEQSLHLYGTRGGRPVIVSSGDAGWMGLSPHVSETLAGQGYFVVGLDSKSYLESFTEKSSHLGAPDVAKDFSTLVDYASRGSSEKPLLLGVSEGAGLSILAATDPTLKAKISGILVFGLPDQNELAWHSRDFVIWFTKKIPNEPTFSAKEIISQVSPVPLAAIHSQHDEFMSVEAEQQMFASAGEPKKLWVLDSKDHSFKDKRPELDRMMVEALSWLAQAKP